MPEFLTSPTGSSKDRLLPTTDLIIDYELQTAAFCAQAAGGGPDPNAIPISAVQTADTAVHTRSYVTDQRTHRTVCHTQCDLYSTCSGWPCCG